MERFERQELNEIAYLHMFLSCAVTELAHGSVANCVYRLTQLINLADVYRARMRLATRDYELPESRPRIVCLCGSTRFWRQFQESSLQETLAGRIVLSIGAARGADDDDKSFGGYTPADQYDAVKVQLDALHFRKIELADEVLVLNVGGHIGESTRNEVNHALSLGKPLRYLEEVSS
jgi:hypothetical protein